MGVLSCVDLSTGCLCRSFAPGVCTKNTRGSLTTMSGNRMLGDREVFVYVVCSEYREGLKEVGLHSLK